MTELINALREDAEWAHGNEWETPITLGDHLDAAADALEAAEKRIAEAVAILQTIEWVGSGAKGRIEDAIAEALLLAEYCRRKM